MLTATAAIGKFQAFLLTRPLDERRFILVNLAKSVGVHRAKGGESNAKPTDGSAGGSAAARLRQTAATEASEVEVPRVRHGEHGATR